MLMRLHVSGSFGYKIFVKRIRKLPNMNRGNVQYIISSVSIPDSDQWKRWVQINGIRSPLLCDMPMRNLIKKT